ncbi:MAG: hypothetical protein JNK87_38210 [Bryobacterales bacterium]|nr:hypothetical protein [Bryobacterales bacterium]
MLAGMVSTLLFGIALQAQNTDCRTPLGVPCYTIEMRQTDWMLFKEGITDISRNVSYSLLALRSDGSTVDAPLDAQRKVADRSVLLRPTNRRLSVDARKRQVTYWKAHPYYDRNVRRSEPTDHVCAGGISHYGSAPPAHTFIGTDRVAGIPVLVYQKAGMSWRWMHEVAMAPSLDCLALRTVRRHLPSLLGDEPGSSHIIEAISVKLGEPSPELFAVPAGYRTVTPPEPSKMLDFLSKYPQVYIHR